MHVEVYSTAHTVREEDLAGKAVAVIDVLRAGSTIVTALHNGARSVIPVADMGAAGRLAGHLDPDVGLLGGERGGARIEGYQAGNSPLEYTAEAVAGRTVVLNTTNGTGALVKASQAGFLTAACFLNADAVAARLRHEASENNREVVLVCAGSEGRAALEDMLCAGYLLEQIWQGKEPASSPDGAHIAFSLFKQDRTRLQKAVLRCNHAQHLAFLGFEADVRYCLQTNAVPVVPVYGDSRLTLEGPKKKRRVAVG